MLLFKIFQEFLLPSVFILVLFLAGVILSFKKRWQKTGKILIILGLVFYYLFSITPVADLILLPLESKYQPIEKEEVNKSDIVVLLLGGGESSILRASEVLRISNFQFPISNQFLNSNFQIIISGTDPLNAESNEAREVKQFLVEKGVSTENIILEERSRTTRESAENLKEILGEEPFFLVTSAYHMERAIREFRKNETRPIPAPTDFKRKENYDILDFFPDARNLHKSDLAFHEYFGIFWYGMRD